jgi:hypothetical protein
MIDKIKMETAVRSVTNRMVNAVIGDVESRPWKFEPPMTAPNMSEGAAILVRVADCIQRIANSQRNRAGEFTKDAVEDAIKELIAWSANYEYRTNESLAPTNAAHPDETEQNGSGTIDYSKLKCPI